jgi:hypothetical protein
MTFTVEKKKRSRLVMASLGWFTGKGYVSRQLQCRYEAWCVLKDGKFYCEAKSEACAKSVANAMRSHHVMWGIK